jgi:hypothetical protein
VKNSPDLVYYRRGGYDAIDRGGKHVGKKYKKPCRDGEDCYDENHLCKIVKRGDLDLIRQLVKDSRFVCSKCGRTAHNVVNLCRPTTI